MPRQPQHSPAAFDHIGASLADAARVWRQSYEAQMADRGQPSAREAAAQALAHIPPEGATQASIGRALGISKQAAQQFVERLCRLDLVLRQPDPQDNRAVRVLLTDQGRQFVIDATEVKAAIEQAYRTAIGNSAFAMLKATLGRLPDIEP
jgi:DNA-binding MarR family transcriptional regulator